MSWRVEEISEEEFEAAISSMRRGSIVDTLRKMREGGTIRLIGKKGMLGIVKRAAERMASRGEGRWLVKQVRGEIYVKRLS